MWEIELFREVAGWWFGWALALLRTCTCGLCVGIVLCGTVCCQSCVLIFVVWFSRHLSWLLKLLGGVLGCCCCCLSVTVKTSTIPTHCCSFGCYLLGLNRFAKVLDAVIDPSQPLLIVFLLSLLWAMSDIFSLKDCLLEGQLA